MKDLLKVNNVFRFFGVLLLGTSLPLGAEEVRWYGAEQVAQGDKLFAENCAACHGKNAESTSDWRKPGADGKYPPPPLNGTAHAWHHSLNLLQRTVRDGGIKTGGVMPAFKDKLSTGEIDAVIASFQAKWSDEIYVKWSGANQPAKDVFSATPIKPDDTSVITKLLRQNSEGVPISQPAKTPVPGVYRVKAGVDYVYLTEDGRYLFTGEIIDLKDKTNLTQTAKSQDIKKALEKLPEKDMVTYPSTIKEKVKVTVMTDTDCPFCKKLHGEVNQLLNAGVTVRYVAYPRAGLSGTTYEDMKSVWCAKDRLRAMNIAKGTAEGNLVKADCAAAKGVDAGFAFGNQIGVNGTPAIILPNGQLIAGYYPANLLLQTLGLQSVTSTPASQ